MMYNKKDMCVRFISEFTELAAILAEEYDVSNEKFALAIYNDKVYFSIKINDDDYILPKVVWDPEGDEDLEFGH